MVFNRYSDWDNDGCSDLDEDDNDDNDDHADEDDACEKGFRNWISNSTTDWDNDGCQDVREDEDDDNDGVDDVNITGDQLVGARKHRSTPPMWMQMDVLRYNDSDNDGVNDLLDQCEGTPQGLQVNGVGC